eukprot:TRINITY_DN253_c0_g2_i1.p2 TRINITY_DN253_c0_g2~~TRINITY_DN253_c0_g2_i1.p2  ORF type:complete len:112 (+),score=3.17 TRINITY_DN253_c0_g2_i1:270-605(+)
MWATASYITECKSRPTASPLSASHTRTVLSQDLHALQQPWFAALVPCSLICGKADPPFFRSLRPTLAPSFLKTYIHCNSNGLQLLLFLVLKYVERPTHRLSAPPCRPVVLV